MIRQIMFYWHILQKDENELLHRFLTAQKISVSSKDWLFQVRKVMVKIKLNMTEEQIKSMNKECFKRIVKVKVEALAMKHLNNVKESHTKTRQLSLTSFSPQQYLLSADLNIEQVQTLYKLRNQMIDVKNNFKSSYKQNMWCRTCLLFPELQQHLMQCDTIVSRLKDIIDFKSLDHSMIFSSRENQENTAKCHTIILKTRTDIIEKMRK